MGPLVFRFATALGVASLIALRVTAWGARVRRRVAPIGTAQTLVPAALGISLAWLVDMLSVMAVLHGVGAPSSAPVAIFVLVTINMAISIPAPANGGTLEFGAIVAPQAIGVEPSKALAFAVLYHGTQVLPVLTIGLWDGPFLWRTGLIATRNTQFESSASANARLVKAEVLEAASLANRSKAQSSPP